MIGFPVCDFGGFNSELGGAVRREKRFSVILSSAHNCDDETLERIYIGRRFKKCHRTAGKDL